MAKRKVTNTTKSKEKTSDKISKTFYKAQKFINPQESYHKLLAQFRKEEIPSNYNQVELLDHLLEENVFHYFSITSRADGKTYNYINTLAYLSYTFGFKTAFIVRHWSLIQRQEEEIREILANCKWARGKSITIDSNLAFTQFLIDDEPILLLTSLKNAMDLKQSSQTLKKFRVVLYDEFITDTDQYTNNEFFKLSILRATINRGEPDFIKQPKIIYLGNAINDESPIFAGFDMYDNLARHEINTIKKYSYNVAENVVGYYYIEMRRNEHQNNKLIDKAFPIDAQQTAEFNFNQMYISRTQFRQAESVDNSVVIKDQDYFITIYKNKDNTYHFKVTMQEIPYNYCTDYKDMLPHTTYISDKFFRHNIIIKNISKINFANSFSKNYILDNLENLNIFRLKFNRHNYNFGQREVNDKKNRLQYSDYGLLDKSVKDILNNTFL